MRPAVVAAFFLLQESTKSLLMRSLLYLLAVLLLVGWGLGAFYWHAGGLIHILFLLAVIAFLFGIIRRS